LFQAKATSPNAPPTGRGVGSRSLRSLVRSPKKAVASSGNVFSDLGFANPEGELLKAKLVREIRGIIKRRKLTQAKAAAMLGLKQPDVSALVTGRVGKFSIDRLVRCLDRMDYKVDVVVRHKPRRGSSRAIAVMPRLNRLALPFARGGYSSIRATAARLSSSGRSAAIAPR
jgi:predicted XRE-type DNA-binding protein